MQSHRAKRTTSIGEEANGEINGCSGNIKVMRLRGGCGDVHGRGNKDGRLQLDKSE